MKSYLNQVVCLECGHTMPGALISACAACSSQWLDARYDYDAIAPLWANGLGTREPSLWRYAELLPLTTPDPEISLAEGYSPLIRLYQYERIYGHEGIYVKDERQGATGSFKDRQAALAVTAMRRAGMTECVLASTGNAAAAYAAYCARAGIKLWLFLTSLVPDEKMREAALYGAEVVRVSGTYDETKHVAAEFAKRKGIHFDRGAKSIPGKEAMKTIAFEIAEQLGLQSQGGRWAAPDWYIQAVSGGIGPLGVLKGFRELYRMGLIDRMPKLGVVQAAGCAPMVEAFHAGKATADPVVPKTLITVLATGDPGHSYVQLREAALENGGAFMAVEDGETFAAMRHVASKAGLSVEPATAVAFAGLARMLQDGTIREGERVVINCSGHTFPAESHVLGDQYLLNLELNQQARSEGLAAALEQLNEQVVTLLVVDDNPNDRRLLRRLLRAYKRYRVLEARSGREAISIAQEHDLDLIIADLTMPEMDGFTLLEHLKQNPTTARIPVVVVSAKSLTEADREVLDKYSNSVWTKGGFETRQLVEHIAHTLGDAPIGIIEPRRAADDAHDDTHDEESDAPIDGQRTVLIIDDNPKDLRLTRRMIESAGGYQVIAAHTGRDGLKLLHERRPDLLILDLVMPDMDGFEVLRAVQHDPVLSETPIIIYSGKSLGQNERASLSASIKQIVEKGGFDRQQFISMINEALI